MERSKSVPKSKNIALRLPKIPQLAIHAVKSGAFKAKEIISSKARGARKYIYDKKQSTKTKNKTVFIKKTDDVSFVFHYMKNSKVSQAMVLQ